MNHNFCCFLNDFMLFTFQNTPANEMLTGLRYFERPIKINTHGAHEKGAFSWGVVDMEALAKCILVICQQLLDIVLDEPRLVVLESPTYILGKFYLLLSNCRLEKLPPP